MDRYDADHPPDPAAWLSLDEEGRLSRVRAHHRGKVLRLHAKNFNAQMHASFHVIVENQVAAAEPAVTRRTVERLTAAGLRRHVAVHMVIEVLLKWLTGGDAFDDAAYAAELDALDAGTWLGERMRRDLGDPNS